MSRGSLITQCCKTLVAIHVCVDALRLRPREENTRTQQTVECAVATPTTLCSKSCDMIAFIPGHRWVLKVLPNIAVILTNSFEPQRVA